MSDQDPRLIATADTLADFLAPVSKLVDECRLHFEGDQLRISAVDPANVAMIDTTLDAHGLESYEGADGQTVGLTLGRVEDVLGLADSGRLVEVAFDTTTRRPVSRAEVR